MKYKSLIAVSMVLSAILLLQGVAAADDLKTRIKKRLPIIIQLKAKGIVGEDNQGYLQFVSGKKDQESLVKAENSDRRKVYHAIAKQQKTTAEKVGQRRALQIARKAKAGEWLQSGAGKWYRKP